MYAVKKEEPLEVSEHRNDLIEKWLEKISWKWPKNTNATRLREVQGVCACMKNLGRL